MIELIEATLCEWLAFELARSELKELEKVWKSRCDWAYYPLPPPTPGAPGRCPN